jgi:hypothetical protein
VGEDLLQDFEREEGVYACEGEGRIGDISLGWRGDGRRI